MRPHSSKTVSLTFFRFYKALRLFFWTSFMFNTTTNMSPLCAENNSKIINDMYRIRTSIVMAKVSFFSCRSIYKDFIIDIIQCERAASPVEMCFIS